MNSGAFTPQEVVDRLAAEMDQVMARMQVTDERNEPYGGCGPRLNEGSDPQMWLDMESSPKANVDEKPQVRTVNYDELVKRWSES